jgi:hypothetical protein
VPPSWGCPPNILRYWVVRECGEAVSRHVLVSTTPGSSDGRLFWLHLCEGYYEREGWAEADLAQPGLGGRDMWEIATGTEPGD